MWVHACVDLKVGKWSLIRKLERFKANKRFNAKAVVRESKEALGQGFKRGFLRLTAVLG